MYDAILFPTDGSERSTRSLDHAVSLATAYDATLYALYVVDQSTYAGLPSDVDRETIRERQEAVGSETVRAIEDVAREAGIELVTEIRSGLPHERIVEVVEEYGIDLVVMGTQGRSGLGRLLLGSTTERVLRSSPVAVHAVPTGET
ncbi:universal stress protein [Natronorarus salvus]|uniref:universal stress protein n=1 Tax=Natronorarus salvus TaxID=3117733 RepID=UPI002F269600